MCLSSVKRFAIHQWEDFIIHYRWADFSRLTLYRRRAAIAQVIEPAQILSKLPNRKYWLYASHTSGSSYLVVQGKAVIQVCQNIEANCF
jgi:hypothetical protein